MAKVVPDVPKVDMTPGPSPQEKLDKINKILADLRTVEGHYLTCLNNTDTVVANCAQHQIKACYTFECTAPVFMLYTMEGYEKDLPYNYKNYVDMAENRGEMDGFCKVQLNDPNAGNVKGCGFGSYESEVNYHYWFTYGVDEEHAGHTYTFIVENVYEQAFMVMDGELMANATYMKEGDKLYVQCVLSEGQHVLELYGFLLNDRDPVWTYSVDGSQEMPLTMAVLNAMCPVHIDYPKSSACTVDTVLMPTQPVYSEGYLEKGKMVIWAMKMRHGQKAVSKTTGSEDIDLYFRWNDCPTNYLYTARAFTITGEEVERYRAPEDGTLYIGVRGYKASTFTLATTCDGEKVMCEQLWTKDQREEYSPGRIDPNVTNSTTEADGMGGDMGEDQQVDNKTEDAKADESMVMGQDF